VAASKTTEKARAKVVKATPRKAPRASTRPNPKLKAVGETASDVIQTAAGVLQDELASGVKAARPVADRFSSNQSLDQDELQQVVERVRKNVHDLVDLVDARMSDLRSAEVQSLSSSLMNDARDVTDVLMTLLGSAPNLVNRVTATNKAEE
jgi:hypothetical protein